MSHMKRLLLTAALISGSGVAMAQDWPTKPIRLIVPRGPASTVDILARTYGDELRKSLGQNIIVDNKTGAGGNIAAAEAARAAPDGYTMLLIAQAIMVFNMALYAKPGYDSLRDLDGVAVTNGVSNVLVVNPGNPAKTVTDLIAQAKAKPGELTYSSGGTGTSHHMSGVLLERTAGISLQHVPYRTTPAGILGVVNGDDVVLGFYNTPTVFGQIKGGKLKAIAGALMPIPKRSTSPQATSHCACGSLKALDPNWPIREADINSGGSKHRIRIAFVYPRSAAFPLQAILDSNRATGVACHFPPRAEGTVRDV